MATFRYHLILATLVCGSTVLAEPPGKAVRLSSSASISNANNLAASQKPPIDYFRQLLAMTPDEREKALASKPPRDKDSLLTKVREYEALQPEERELRLRSTQLQWHLGRLFRMESAARNAYVEKIAAEDRPLILDRLNQWDQLTPEAQDEFLENERMLRWFVRYESSTPEERRNILTNSPLAHHEWSLGRWLSFSQEQRQKMCERFHQFFELSDREKKETLRVLSQQERLQMETNLVVFEKLPPDQRKHCIESFRKFARMTPDERDQFLKNAQRWEQMDPAQREMWRDLVQKAPSMPPLPPGMLPPLPAPMSVMTNSRAH
jgi:hypothetical protein